LLHKHCGSLAAQTLVVLLHKHYCAWLCTFCNSVSIIVNCTCARSEPNVAPYVSSSFTFFQLANYIQFLFNTDCLSPILTWIALGDTNLCLSLILVTKFNAVEGVTTWAMWLCHQYNQSMLVWWCDIDCHFMLASYRNECSQASCMPNHIKPKLIL